MMNFLRKHQRFFFILITTIIVASFAFFGDFRVGGAHESAPDREVAKAIDGSSIMEREVQAMSRFLSMGETTFLQNEFLGTGLSAILAEKYFAEIQDEFGAKLDRVKRYRPYQHPQAPFISAEEVWKRFSPALYQHLQELRQKEATPEAFALYAQLYLDQAAFPPHLLKKILSYQQQQYNLVSHDHELSEQKLSLFGFHSPEEWFGPKFLELTCKFLINASVIAEQRGYKISNEEALADLLQNALTTLKQYTQKQDVTYADADAFLRHQLQASGIDEIAAKKIWKKVMLTCRLFDEVGQGVFLDDLTYQQFSAYAGEKATVELYQLPEALRFSRPLHLQQFFFYLDMVSPKSRGKMPAQMLSVEEMEKRCPELVQSRFFLDVAKISKEEAVSSKVTLKETWDFEMTDEGWALIVKEFPIIGKFQGTNLAERFVALESIEPELRVKIDKFMRYHLLDRHAEWMEEALAVASKQQLRLAIRSRGSNPYFAEIENPPQLLNFLYQASLNEPLPLYTEDKNTFYQITVLEKPACKEIMTFAEGVEEGVLAELFDKRLEEVYPDIRRKHEDEFQLENGSWKPYATVREKIGFYLYGDKNPLIPYVEQIRQGKGVNKQTHDRLKDQFLLVKNVQDIKRSEAISVSKEELFSLQEGEWSSVQTPANGDISYFQLIKRGESTDPIADQVSEGHKILSMDARRYLMRQLLDQI